MKKSRDSMIVVRIPRDEKKLARQLAELEERTLSDFTREALKKEVQRRLSAGSEARP